MVYRLIYSSKAVEGLTDSDLDEILHDALENNGTNDITGILMFYEGDFIQVLEGDRDVVTRLYKTIEKDPRHSNVDLLLDDLDTERMFGDWRMGFVPLDEDSASRICGNLDVDSIDHLVKVSKRNTLIIQSFLATLMQEMTENISVKNKR